MKRVVITGISGGLGSEIAKQLLLLPSYEVVGIGRTEPATGWIGADQKKRFTFVPFDLEKSEAIPELFQRSIKGDPIHALVNNAASAYDDLVTNANHDRLLKMFNVNVLSSILLSKMVLRDMLLHEVKGALVHISSLAAHTGYKGLAMYGATKGAIEAFSLGVAREYGPRGIRSNCVAPGFMKTKMTEVLSPADVERIARRASLQTLATVESTASTVRFLLSPEATSITGTVVRVDAGSV